jgi:hypothetical protein
MGPALAGAQTAVPGKFYEYHVVAATGDTPANAPSALMGMGDNPSINSKGVVGFVGQFTTGEFVVVNDWLSTRLINPDSKRLVSLVGRFR